MASTYWPDGSPKSVDDIEYEVLGTAFAPDGIVGYPGDSSVVFGDSSGRQVKIRAGKFGQVKGRGWASGATDIIKSIAANGTGQPRIDLVVLGLNRATWALTEYVLTGVAAASPVPPALTRAAMGPGTGLWEIPLATVAVAAGAASISAANVTPIHTWIGEVNPLTFGSLAAMQAFAPATNGMRAEVDGAPYLRTGGAWKRADWNTAWGSIGGQQYSISSAAFGGDIGSSDTIIGDFTTGAIPVVAGRRYEIEAYLCAVRLSANGGIHFRIKDDNLAGATRGNYRVDMVSGHLYDVQVLGKFDCAADGTKQWVMSAVGVGTGNCRFQRSAFTPTFYEVRDIGPSGRMTPLT